MRGLEIFSQPTLDIVIKVQGSNSMVFAVPTANQMDKEKEIGMQ